MQRITTLSLWLEGGDQMILTTVNNLDEYKIFGLNFTEKKVDMTANTSQGGVKSVLIRKIEYSYNLVLQALTKSEVQSIEEQLLTATLTEDTISIDESKAGGYLNHMKISGSPSFNLDYESVKVTEDGDLYGMTIPLLESDINPRSRLGV